MYLFVLLLIALAFLWFHAATLSSGLVYRAVSAIQLVSFIHTRCMYLWASRGIGS